jgi:phosphate transport system substrate-binding protein
VNYKKYFIKTFLLAFLGTPLIVSFLLIFAAGFHPVAIILVILFSIAAIVLLWVVSVKKNDLSMTFIKRYLPVLAAFSYYMILWIIAFGTAGYRFDKGLFSSVFLLPLELPYFLLLFFFALAGEFSLLPFMQIGLYAVILITVFITNKIDKKNSGENPETKKGAVILVLVFAGLSAITVYQHFDRNAKILSWDYDILKVEDEIHNYDYHPFGEDNMLQSLSEVPSLTISSGYPKLDGATAAYPVYGAMAEMIYQGLDYKTVGEYVKCSQTIEAYENLIDGSIDIFFGAQPSKQQLEAAEEKGVTLVMTPIAKEAFVFIVNSKNPVDNLTLEQIQNIYMKSIVNWKMVGGNDEKIQPFQRPPNSGSQTIMLAKVMQGKPLPAPLIEEYSGGMGGIISDVAAYRNYSSAIGYSFRYFATGMESNDNIKLLAVGGIEPSVENIRTGVYPFTIDTYAVTTENESENTLKLIEWILSDQGQRLIEKCGYVGIREPEFKSEVQRKLRNAYADFTKALQLDPNIARIP